MHHMYPGLRLQGDLGALIEQCTDAQPAAGVALLDLTLELLQVCFQQVLVYRREVKRAKRDRDGMSD